MDKIKDKLFKDLKPGSVIIASTFGFTNIEPSEKFGMFNIYYIK